MQTTITFQDHHLTVLMAALEAFQRAKIGQFKTALENIFPIESYRLGYDALQECEDLLKSKYFPEYGRHAGPGICNEKVGKDTHLAYEMYKVIEQYRSLRQSDGWFKMGCNFDGLLLNPSGEKAIKIEGLDELLYKDFEIPVQFEEESITLYDQKEWNAVWAKIDEWIPDLPRGEKSEIILGPLRKAGFDYNADYLFVRVHKPRKP